MIKTCLTATTILALMSGLALAQTSTTSTTTTQTTAPVAVPMPGATTWSTSQRTTDVDGVTTDKTRAVTTGTTIAPNGDVATTRRTTETTTTR